MALTYKVYNDWGRQFNRLKTVEHLWAINQVRMDLGADATGDLLYRGADSLLARLPIGGTSDYLGSNGTEPEWKSFNDFAWKLDGNSGTNFSVNFLGTTDAQSLVFKTNGVQAGLITHTVSANPAVEGGSVYLGQYAGQAHGTANSYSVFIGHAAGKNEDHGETVAIGNWAGYYSKGPDPFIFTRRSVFIGQSAGYRTQNAGYNVFIGPFAAISNHNGRANTAVGPETLKSSTTGWNNSAYGLYSLYTCGTGVGSITVEDGGTGYPDGTITVTISAPLPGAPGVTTRQATATALVVGGVIQSVTVLEPGLGYSSLIYVPEFGSYPPPTATVTGGTGAVLTVNLLAGDTNTGLGSQAGWGNELGKFNTYVGTTFPGRYNDYITLMGYGANVNNGAFSWGTKIVNATAIGKNARVDISNALVLGGTGADSVNVGIGTASPTKKLDVVGGDALINGITVGTGPLNVTTNVAIGTQALNGLTVAHGANTAIGYRAMYLRNGELANTAVGFEALYSNTNYQNTAIGAAALRNNTAGRYNTAVGTNAMRTATSALVCTAVGVGALANATSFNNTAIGFGAGIGITSAQSCTAIGTLSMGKGNVILGGTPATTGNNHTAIGYQTLYNVTSGIGCVALGHGSGSAITTGSYNVVIGGNTGSTIATLDNRIIISDGQGNIRLTIDNNGKITYATVPPEYIDNADALLGGLFPGDTYRTGDFLKVVH